MNRYRIVKLILISLNISWMGLSCLSAQNIQNPVLPGVADAGVIKYNGKYYIGGVYTNGDFYVSKDLVNWEGPVHVFDMDNDWTRGSGAGNNQIHANDMIYLNGQFHLYWSVNYWGKDRHAVHIAHAVSDNILGPYIEPVKDTWMDNRIDPQVFKDDDGKLYMYMVKFTDGNTIWARPMKDPYTFTGTPVYQFASLPDTWETVDNRVAEGPWVIKYRNQYYMMYNANHTATEWGNYQLGVAQADTPTSFNHGNKYPYPLLLSNQTLLEEKYADLLKFEDTYHPDFNYITTQPRGDWKKLNYDDSSWSKGEPGFSNAKVEGSTARYQGTEWNTETIYLRKKFNADKSNIGNLALRMTHDGDTKVYLNGQLIYEKTDADYVVYNLTDKDKAALTNGKNVLAIESYKGRRNYLNASLFDMKDETADDILYSPGQPNIVWGLNGFEWWLVYMANKNKERRSQYINRIYFHNKTMHTHGITASNTKGYLPEPTKPTYGDTFDNDALSRNAWKCQPSVWGINNGEYISPDTNATAVLNNQPTSVTYLFEAGIKTGAKAGIIAWWKDNKNWIKIGLDAQDKKWYIEECRNKLIQTQSYDLPADFRFNVYHKIGIERNTTRFSIRIDDIPAPGLAVLNTSNAEKGVPGLFSEDTVSYFDGVIYTIGWDEFDNHIMVWGDAEKAEKAQGEYVVGEEGITTSFGKFQAFKGDLLSQYEFSVQIASRDGRGVAGAYPVYADRNNYIKTVFDFDNKKLIVSEVVNSKTISETAYPLEGWNVNYADAKYTDSMDKGYSFAYPTWISGIQLNRIAVDDKSFIENMFDKMTVEYMSNGKWYPISISNVTEAANPLYNQIVFDPVKAEALRFINKEPQDLNRHIYKIRVKEVFKDSYNLRCVKLAGSTIILVDGKEVCRLSGNGKPAQVGLYSDLSPATFNGILRYHIPVTK